jgi:TM2 domain-containing membrane protein YozV
MNCANHPETTAVAYCRTCGKALCGECRCEAQGTVFCGEHAPQAAPPSTPQTTPAQPGGAPIKADVSPGLALFLGFVFPGVGAIYNGQYAKGLVHALIFGLMVTILSSGATHGLEPLFGIGLAVFIFYMALEAYHTALKRRTGEPVDEFSSLLNLNRPGQNTPAGAITLVVIGSLLLLNNMEIIRFRQVVRFWPVLLIGAGILMLINRRAEGGPNE